MDNVLDFSFVDRTGNLLLFLVSKFGVINYFFPTTPNSLLFIQFIPAPSIRHFNYCLPTIQCLTVSLILPFHSSCSLSIPSSSFPPIKLTLLNSPYLNEMFHRNTAALIANMIRTGINSNTISMQLAHPTLRNKGDVISVNFAVTATR